ncbi:MAG: hypothetical protein KKD44_07610 [Proteobacteria bacterium]|nr:hypothetical protein [Pseudomonadota bacterium]
MYYSGVFIHEKQSESVVVVVEKVLRNARKEYHVKDIRTFSWEKDSKDLIQNLQALYDDPQFLRKKKVFSQSKRPPKNTYTPPLLIVSVKEGGDQLINRLRDNQIPVDAVFFDEAQGWTREDQKILRFGTNYHLHPSEMQKLRRVLLSPNVILDQADSQHRILQREMDLCLAMEANSFDWSVMFEKGSGKITPTYVWPHVFQDESFHLFPALSLVLWHCETIRQIKRY